MACELLAATWLSLTGIDQNINTWHDQVSAKLSLNDTIFSENLAKLSLNDTIFSENLPIIVLIPVMLILMHNLRIPTSRKFCHCWYFRSRKINLHTSAIHNNGNDLFFCHRGNIIHFQCIFPTLCLSVTSKHWHYMKVYKNNGPTHCTLKLFVQYYLHDHMYAHFLQMRRWQGGVWRSHSCIAFSLSMSTHLTSVNFFSMWKRTAQFPGASLISAWMLKFPWIFLV